MISGSAAASARPHRRAARGRELGHQHRRCGGRWRRARSRCPQCPPSIL